MNAHHPFGSKTKHVLIVGSWFPKGKMRTELSYEVIFYQGYQATKFVCLSMHEESKSVVALNLINLI